MNAQYTPRRISNLMVVELVRYICTNEYTRALVPMYVHEVKYT